MAEEQTTEDELDEELEVEAAEEQAPRKSKPKPSPTRKQVEIRKDTPRFARFNVEAREGIVDTVTGQILVDNIWDALADIKNDLYEIKEQVSLQ